MAASPTADWFFERRYHDYVVRSVVFGPDIDIALASASGRTLLLRLEDVVVFRAKGVMETNIVVAVSFEPLRLFSPDAFIAIVRRFGNPGGDETLRAVHAKYRDYGLLSADEWVKRHPHTMLDSHTITLTPDEVRKYDQHVFYFKDHVAFETGGEPAAPPEVQPPLPEPARAWERFAPKE